MSNRKMFIQANAIHSSLTTPAPYLERRKALGSRPETFQAFSKADSGLALGGLRSLLPTPLNVVLFFLVTRGSFRKRTYAWCVCYISPHMRRTALDEIEGWDSHNVTEDADLSFRLAAQNWTLGYIRPPTQEEAVSNFKAWHFQRARWMKGFLQTWQCHMRAPFAPGGIKGVARFFTLQLTLGLTLISALFHLPVMAGVAIYCLLQYLSGALINIPAPFLASLAISYGAGMLIGAVGAIRAGKPALLLSVPFMPLYWFALCAPTLRALWELRRNPFHWHKTEHGVSPQMPLKTSPESLTSLHEHIG